jgi:hypothetical protein
MLAWLRRVCAWLLRVFAWLAEVRTFWLIVVVFLIAIFLPQFVGKAEDVLRWSGLVLQLLGIGVVAYTLRARSKLFDRGSVVSLATAWLKRAPRFRPPSITLTGIGTAYATSEACGVGGVVTDPQLDKPIEAQLEVIRKQVDAIEQQFAAFTSQTNNLGGQLQAQLDAEQSERSRQHAKMKKTIGSLATDSLHLEVAGVLWLAVGMVLSTIPREICWALPWLCGL